jgi:uncharacterized membrane protein SirB2
MSLESLATRVQGTAFSEQLQAIAWVVPTLQTLHIMMIGVVFVSLLMIALRVLGRVRVEEPFEQVWRRFAPFLWSGIVVMATTGALLVVAEPVREVMALSFRIKMVLLVVGIASAIWLARRARAAIGAGAGAQGGLRFASVATVLLWLFIIFLGRAIAYDDSVWGDWSPAVLQRGGAT